MKFRPQGLGAYLEGHLEIKRVISRPGRTEKGVLIGVMILISLKDD